jgi:hypothetical protein
MTRFFPRFIIGGILLVAGVVGLGYSPTQISVAQEDKKGRENKNVGTLGSDQCINCHVQGWVFLPNPAPAPEYKELITTFLDRKEMAIWSGQDMHFFAFQCLDTPLAKTMEANLGYKVKEAAQCLVCHSVDTLPGKDLNVGTVQERFDITNGMSCEACHGFAKGWYDGHSVASWRKNTPEWKAEKGLLDMRNPHVRAEKCSSCHVGNSAEKKILTHDMYAAGHPPLVPLDVVTFSEQQPIHWIAGRKNEFLTKLSEGKIKFNIFTANGVDPGGKGSTPPSAEEQKKIARENYYYREGESKQVRDWAISSITTLFANIRLIHDEAATSSKEKRLMDFAMFDCFACHHDLKYPSDRQRRGYETVPGRPIIRKLSVDVVRAIIPAVAGADKLKEFDDGLLSVTKAIGKSPFAMDVTGEVTTATSKFEAWGKELLTTAEKTLYDKSKVEAIYKAVSSDILALPTKYEGVKSDKYIDYETAQQMTWAVKLLADECKAFGVSTPDVFDKGIEKLNPTQSGLPTKDGKPSLIFYLRYPKATGYTSVQDRLNERLDPMRLFNQVDYRKAFGQ